MPLEVVNSETLLIKHFVSLLQFISVQIGMGALYIFCSLKKCMPNAKVSRVLIQGMQPNKETRDREMTV